MTHPDETTARVAGFVRERGGTTSVTAFLTTTVVTVLVTRVYLQATGYPQIGGGSLHIAHALYGGALMVAALVAQWLFLGFRVRNFSIAVGGIGFGLFIDEVGKFVTKSNDYFFHPAADIIYVTVVAVIGAGNAVRLIRRPTPHEALSNAADIAARGVARGLSQRRRQDAENLLRRALDGGADPAVVRTVGVLVRSCPAATDRGAEVRAALSELVPPAVRSPFWVTFLGWLLVATSLATCLTSAVDLPWRPSELLFHAVSDRHLQTISNTTYIVLGGAVFLTAGAGMIGRAHARRRRLHWEWPLRALQTATVVFTLVGGLVDFAQFGFAALASIAVGLITLAAVNSELTRLRRCESPEERADRILM